MKMSESKIEKTQESSSKPKRKLINILEELYDKYYAISFVVAAIAIITIFLIGADECRRCFYEERTIAPKAHLESNTKNSKKFWAYGKDIESGYLSNVFTILERLGYEYDPKSDDWDLLWAHDYPFRKLWPQLRALKPHQKVNHFPGCGYITNKVDLATSGLKYIPPAFKLPEDKQTLLNYAEQNPNKIFVQKNNDHRNIKVKTLNEIDLDSEGTFVQEYVERPLLVNGHKFDIGIYTIITSIDPLRMYIWNGDALLRFCPVKYYPFDPENLDKYVVGDDYLPIWEVPALDYYYNHLGFGMRESLNSYLADMGRDGATIWEQIEEAIRIIVLDREAKIAEVTNKFKTRRNFFELMRFDFVVDEDLQIYLLEANMSPNLSSAHFPPNLLMYQQVLYNVMGLLGIGERIQKNTLAFRSTSEQDMLVSFKDIATFPKECYSHVCRNSCMAPVCQLCKKCLSPQDEIIIKDAYLEHVNKGSCKRIFPPTLNPKKQLEDLTQYSPENQLHIRWFYGKCLIDHSWC